jgi:hypothetical protein
MVPALYVTRRNGVQERTEQARQKASQDDLLREAKTHFGLLSLACVASSLIAGSRMSFVAQRVAGGAAGAWADIFGQLLCGTKRRPRFTFVRS